MRSLYLFLVFLSCVGYSQTQKGTVVDSLKVPIENAYLVNLTSNSDDHTDEFGRFFIENSKIGDVVLVK